MRSGQFYRGGITFTGLGLKSWRSVGQYTGEMFTGNQLLGHEAGFGFKSSRFGIISAALRGTIGSLPCGR